MGLKSKKHVKKLFFQSPTRFFGLFKFHQASGEFLKKMVEISEIVGFFGRFDFFKLFLVLFSWSKTPKTFEKPKNSSKSRFWIFFSHYDLFTFSEVKFWKPNITMCWYSDRPNKVGNRCIMSLTKLKQLYWKQKSSFWLIFGLI